MDERKRQRGNDMDITGRTVAANVRRIRIESRMMQADLSAAMSRVGRPIPVASIGKLETGLRKVEVDDLMALAVALNVSPLALLLPDTRRPNDPVEGVGIATTAVDLWRWGVGDSPLEIISGKYEDVESDVLAFRSLSLPWWLQVLTDVPTDHLHPESRERMYKRHEEQERDYGQHPQTT